MKVAQLLGPAINQGKNGSSSGNSSGSNNEKKESIWSIAKQFLKDGTDQTGTFQESKYILEDLGVNTKSKFEELVGVLWGLGLLAIFISTVVLGIKYMLVDPAEKSKIKQATTPYIVGVVVIFGCTAIWKLIIIILDGSL